MAPFFLTITLVGLLIFGGVVVNLYLYSRGVVGTGRLRRSRPLRTAAAGSLSSEAIAEEYYTTFNTPVDETARYARSGILIFSGVVLAVSVVVIAFLSAVLH